MAHATTTPSLGTIDALRQILAEVTPGIRPYSTDSYLPSHLVDLAQRALDRHTTAPVDHHHKTVETDDHAGYQHAFNAMSAAGWHCARGEAQQALTRLRRAQSHLFAVCEVTHG